MPQIIIDGRSIEATQGKTIIEAALDSGITIPHFCWHPALSVAGNCRMCLVNVGSHKKDTDGSLMYAADGTPIVSWIPKMQIACATPVADGMIVDTTSEKTVLAQNAVMEFLLVNHPLDCPICDEAGQCKLQEYAFLHSKGQSRFDEEKVHKEKRVELGPNVMFDGERCISCSRCIRFADEVAKQPVLSFVQRGDKVTIRTFPGTQFDSQYSMNVIDICPVGALTSIDFRFKARVWEMSFTDSVCPGCARGCNIKIGVMDNSVLRTEPRTNMHVNSYWMCDHGRLMAPSIVNEDRLSGPMIRSNGVLTASTWEEAISAVADSLKGLKGSQIAVIGSAHASNEDNYALARLASDVLQTSNLDYVKHNDHSFGDEVLRVNDVSPNAIGAHSVGLTPKSDGHGIDHMADRILRGDVKALIVMGEDLGSHSVALAEAAATVDTLIVLGTHNSVTAKQANILLPMNSWAESEGTFTNMLHRVQRFEAAVTTADTSRSMAQNKMSRWDKFGAPNDRWMQGVRRDCRLGWRIVAQVASALGVNWPYTSSSEVFQDLAKNVGAFSGMSYALLDAHQGLVLGKASSPEPAGVVYESHVMKPQ
ncbi:MAG: molybdopterin-dependent oxidoreductase [Candidatus Kapabacteria bacterium]|nr:molybdopterin-dependent oxidoreductase [Candidatus Kapabacteria bacterium]